MINKFLPTLLISGVKAKLQSVWGHFAYEVAIDGRFRKAHVEHMHPCFANTNEETVILDSQANNAIVSQESDKATSNACEIIVPRVHIPTKRLIKEMD